MPIYDPTAVAGDLELSKTYIGATKAPILYMVEPAHPYSTPYAVWMEKTGRIVPEDISEKDVVEVGNEMEQIIANLWYKKHKDEGWSVPEKMVGLYRDEEFPFIACHIDFISRNSETGEEILIECKNSGMDIKKWKPEPPDHYYLQCQYEMLVTKTTKCVLAAWVGNRQFIEHTIVAYPELQEGIKAAVIKFWRDHVKTDVHPPLSFKDVDLLKEHMPENLDEIIEVHDEILPELTEFLKVYEQHKELKVLFEKVEQALKLCDAKLLDKLKDSNAKIVKVGEAEIKRWWQNNPPSWNTNVMQQKYPEAYAECRKQTSSPRYSIKIKKVVIL